jgi:lipoprotein NlpD
MGLEIIRRPQMYIVKKGDTLSQIAKDNGVKVADLAAWNNIKNPDLIYPGKVLVFHQPFWQKITDFFKANL